MSRRVYPFTQTCPPSAWAGARPAIRRPARLMSEGPQNLFSATFGGLLSGFAGVATFHMAHLLFARLL